ncbi:flagellar hook-basal body complex protein [Lysobacter pythonis]|uniref:Flagellar hook-basal body complex protein n=1 Tax=Solilutibacter pythonis TaxID=2483112 RepID=A0A3M2I271_9GAMM|nr:flagellar hook-basal body complex protein [Lysobacter pythonis]RMH94070.1 flagellar hook-basal body complex protein [Lysobacter pythonis]
MDAMHIAATGLRSEQKQIEVISNNVANMQTPGFKRGRVNFVDVAAAASPSVKVVESRGNGTRVASTSTLFSNGEMRMTQNPLDVAIEGPGFFELDDGMGELAYTRAGQFRLDAEGYLVTAGGLRLANGFQVPLGASGLRISANGGVTAQLPGEVGDSFLGTIELAIFAAPEALQSQGGNLFRPTALAGTAIYLKPGDPGSGRLHQGYVELANVELIEEMSALVLAQRAYQMNARVLQAADQVMDTINNLRR